MFLWDYAKIEPASGEVSAFSPLHDESVKENRQMSSVALSKLVEKLDLKNVTPEVDISHIRITTPEINRPALQLAGYFAHFAYENECRW